MITARWLPLEREVRLATRTARRSRPFLVRQPARLAGVVLAALVGLAVLELDLAGWGGLALALGLVLFGDVLGDRRPWQVDARLRHAVAATLDGDGVRWSGNGVLEFDESWPWSAFTHAVETGELFVLVGPRFVPYLPKRALADADAVRALLAARVEVRSPRPGRRWSRPPGSAGTGSGRSWPGSSPR